MHQIDLLLEVANFEEVVLVVESEVDHSLEEMGWDFQIPEHQSLRIVKMSDYKSVETIIIETKEEKHIVSGIRGIKLCENAISHFERHKIDYSIFMESIDRNGLKGKLRVFLYRRRFKKLSHLKRVFLAGNKNRFEESFGDLVPRTIQWGYFLGQLESCDDDVPKDYDVCFVGRHDKRKNIFKTLKYLDRHFNRRLTILLVGDGPDKKDIVQYKWNSIRITHVGTQANSKVGGFISRAHLLLLPSIFDGWGCVVNEALRVGTKVLVSANCGSSALVTSPHYGAVFLTMEDLLLRLKLILSKDYDKSVAQDHYNKELCAKVKAMELIKHLS